MQITHNVLFRVIDKGTGKVVREYEGHNQATNTMLTGIGHYLAGDGTTNANAILGAFVPKYISLGTMGLINQKEDENGLPIGIGGVNSTMPDDPSTESESNIIARYTAYMEEAPGYGADGYKSTDPTYNNNRGVFGLGPVYDSELNQGEAIKCELISATFPRAKISRRQFNSEEYSEVSETIDVVVSAMISTGALAQFRNGNDYVFITEAGLWSTSKYSSSGSGLLAGYRIKPPNDVNWDMTIPTNRQILQENIIRVGINQVVQVIWKIQVGSIKRLDTSGGIETSLKGLIQRDIQSITIPNGTTNIGEMAFSDCTSMTGITIPDTVTDIGSYSFRNCSALTSIKIPSSVVSIGSLAFLGCSNLEYIIISKAAGSIPGYADRWGAPNSTIIIWGAN